MRPVVLYSVVFIFILLSIASGQDVAKQIKDSQNLQISSALDGAIQEHISLISTDSIKSYIDKITDFKTRFMLADNRKEIAQWFVDKFKSFAYDQIAIDSFQNTIEWPMQSGQKVSSWQYNASATLPGSATQDTICVLGAHYDCMIMGPGTDPYKFSPGADNNASGLAVCLEIARVLKQSGFEPKYPIQFVAFGSEEFMTMFVEGESGSQTYIAALKHEGKTVKLMLDNNQVSFSPDTAAWKLDFQNYPGSENLTALAHMICDKYTKITPVDTSDHTPYSDARYFHEAGYPTIFFEEYHFNPYTFTDEDIPENCNFDYCAEVAKISCGILIYSTY